MNDDMSTTPKRCVFPEKNAKNKISFSWKMSTPPKRCVGKMKNEDSRGLKKLYRGRNYVPKFQNILRWSKHLKRRRNKHFQHQTHSQAPRHTKGGAMCPKTCTWALSAWNEAHGAWRMVLDAWHLCLAVQGIVLWLFVKKAHVFSPKLGENFPYKYRLSHS